MGVTGPTKKHPGCTPPTLPSMPDIDAALNNAILGFALKRLAPPKNIAIRAAEVTNRINQERTYYQDQVNEILANADKLLNNPCPLPKVVDKAARM